MNVEELKEQARRHELKEEWQKALELYREALRRQDEDEPPDISLYNRVGDIQTRLGQTDGAVEHYAKAVDLYLEAELPNNAIAVCKKVLRNLPDRIGFFRRMGQIRASQGFLTDARENFLTFAERATAAGDTKGALDALLEFVELSPGDTEMRLALASQLEVHDRIEEAANQLREARARLLADGDEEGAAAVAAKLEELAPRLPAAEGERVVEEDAGRAEETGGEEEELPSFEATLPELGEAVPESEELILEPTSLAIPEAELEESAAGALEATEPAEEVGAEPALSMESALGDLPLLSLGDESEPPSTLGLEHEAEELAEEVRGEATFAVEEALEEASEPAPAEELLEEAAPEPLPRLDQGGEEEVTPREDVFGAPEEAVGVLPTDHEAAARRGDLSLAMAMVRTLIEEEPDRVDHHQRLVEYAFRTGDRETLVSAYMGLAGCLERTGSRGKAKAVYQQVLSLAPEHKGAAAALQGLEGQEAPPAPAQVASSEEYVDLGALVLGEEAEKTTRWKVAADAPSGDDQADFAKMLSQFKEKVSEHVAVDDVAAHHDLGTAYMEMGLLDEAIGEFQLALRTEPGHLPTHEVMGRCWLEKGEPEIAVRALKRALQGPHEVEDDLIGIYYLLGRAQEELGNTEEAVEFYEKVFTLDINFQDVTQRLRALR